MQDINRLTLAAYGMHLADQIALVSVPLVAALVFEASAQTIGVLVACQSMAHLLGSLPFGLLVDRAQSRTIAIAATMISLGGFAGAAASILAENLFWFGVAVTVAGFGIGLFVLVSLSILPKIMQPGKLAGANARIEIPRALSSFFVPLTVGLAITAATSQWIFPIAALCALIALTAAVRLPRFAMFDRKHQGVFKQLVEGGSFVLRHELLLPISLCAVFWNLAFFALLVVMVPLIVDVYRVEPGVFGVSLSAFGLAAIAGAWSVGRFADRIPPGVILLFGPGSSVLAVAALLLIPPGGPVTAIYAAFFVLGFGPSMWLIAQNSVRHLVTPGAMLGRVNAVIQTAIYGVRPLGAMLGGVVVDITSPQTGLAVVAAAYAASFAAALFSRLRAVKCYADLAPAGLS